MRPGLCAVALCGQGPVHLEDARRVVGREIDAHLSIIEPKRQGFKAGLHKLPCVVIVRQVDAVEEVCSVPAVRHERLRPAKLPQPFSTLDGPVERSFMLLLGRGDPAWTNRVEVQRKPSALQDVRIASRVFSVGLHSVDSSAKQYRVYRIQRHVDAGSLTAQSPGLSG